MDRISIITLALAKKFTKDTVAALEQVVRYIGVTTTAISDGSTTNPITINGQSVTVVAGDTVFYNGTSYAWDGNAWQEVINIAEIITAVEALGGKVHDILGDIAPEFNSESTYAVDDVVLYEDDLYIFTNAHTGAWDSSDVAVTSIAQLVDDLRAEIASTNGRVSALETHVTQSGDVIDSDNHSLHIVGEAIETEKTVSGNPITITDALPYNAVSLSAEIEAIQDLHGYDKPWVGGAGKNKLHNILTSQEKNGVTVTVYNDGHIETSGIATSNVPFKLCDLTTDDIVQGEYILTGCPNDGSTSTYFLEYSNAINYAYNDTGSGATITSIFDKTSYPNASVNLQVRSGTNMNGKSFYPMLRLSTETDATYAPYSNICPISGRTEARVDDVGKNLVEDTLTSATITSAGVIQTTAESYDIQIAKVKSGETYTITSNELFVGGFFTNKPVVGSTTYDGSRMADTPRTFTAPIDGYVAFRTSGGYSTPQCELGSSATAYEPYKSSSAIIQLGQTVYGGTLNVTTGVLTVKTTAVDGGSLNWSYWDSGIFIATIADKTALNVTDIKCSCYKRGREDGGIFCLVDNENQKKIVYIWDSSYSPDATGAAALKTALTGQQIEYRLATPQTIQLTPTQLTMLKGYNRLSSDGGGDITLTYRANKADSVQAEVDVLETTKADNADVVDYIENGNTASRAYSANQFILWKGDLYKVTTSIASGATITAGTNVSKTTIGAVLTAILNA